MRCSRSSAAIRWTRSTPHTGWPGGARGGGAVPAAGVGLAVRRRGHLLWLRAPLDLGRERAAAGRPLLAGDAKARLTELAAAREPVFARIADGVVEVQPGIAAPLLAT